MRSARMGRSSPASSATCPAGTRLRGAPYELMRLASAEGSADNAVGARQVTCLARPRARHMSGCPMPKPANTASKKRAAQSRAAPTPSPAPPAYFEDTGRTLPDGRKLWRPLPALDALPQAERDALLAEKQGTILYEVKADNYTLGPLDFARPPMREIPELFLLML